MLLPPLQVEAEGSQSGKTKSKVVIADSGELPVQEGEEL